MGLAYLGCKIHVRTAICIKNSIGAVSDIVNVVGSNLYFWQLCIGMSVKEVICPSMLDVVFPFNYAGTKVIISGKDSNFRVGFEPLEKWTDCQSFRVQQ